MDVVAQIEAALEAHWSSFGRWSHGELHEHDGLVRFETPIRHLPYNGVVRTRLGEDADAVIGRVVARYRERGADCFWFVSPGSTPGDLPARLEAHGLRAVERVTYMSLELGDWEAAELPDDLAFEEVVNAAAMEAYTALTLDYWEIPEGERALVAALHRELGPGRVPGHRYLALGGGRPLGKAYLSLAGPPGVGAIYGMSVRPEARGRGVAAALTTVLVARARAEGCERVVLHSSEMAIGVYRRAGFTVHRTQPVYASAAIWSGEH